MRTTNALAVRRTLGKVLTQLERGGEPVVVERAGRPVAVLVPIEAYRERFADRTATEEREALHAEILAERPTPRSGERRRRASPTAELRRLRGALP